MRVLLQHGSWIILVVLGTASALAQGSLAPSGAPAPMMKTLDQLESRTPISSLPYAITQPGSYYVTSNLTCAAGSTGIFISALSATLDLNGFTLTGPGTSGGSAIYASSANRYLKVFNGRLYNWNASDAYAIYDAQSDSVNIKDVAIDNCGYGIYAFKGVIENVQIFNCTRANGNFIGISGSALSVLNCVIHDCEATADSCYGISVSSASVVRDCVVRDMTGGINAIGYQGQSGSIIENCVAKGCDVGINIYNQSVLRNNICVGNRLYGIYVTYGGSRIEGNHLIQNGQYGLYNNQNCTNLMIGNSACVNSNGGFYITRGHYGPIDNTPCTTSVTVSNHPWANFDY